MSAVKPYAVTFVCLGNICRSPLGEAVFKKLVRQAGREAEFQIESAGLGGWHVGQPPDSRSQIIARQHGIVLESTAQQFHPRDLERFDLILALDHDIFNGLRRMAGDTPARQKIHLLRAADPQARANLDVPDPYYGDLSDFESAYQLIERSCRAWLERLPQQNPSSLAGE
ncbi:MAG: low molecular weight protein-tyrosine-phosphatase [Anaerolineales bacterium]|jgi:protein-tyrosine phosphatase|nr:low molecular weight protein-tyrosine-phosphatase [Anaerolineales bacterium]